MLLRLFQMTSVLSSNEMLIFNFDRYEDYAQMGRYVRSLYSHHCHGPHLWLHALLQNQSHGAPSQSYPLRSVLFPRMRMIVKFLQVHFKRPRTDYCHWKDHEAYHRSCGILNASGISNGRFILALPQAPHLDMSQETILEHTCAMSSGTRGLL